MNFQQAVQSGFSNYAKFRGRAARSEFWWFQLFIVLGGIVATSWTCSRIRVPLAARP